MTIDRRAFVGSGVASFAGVALAHLEAGVPAPKPEFAGGLHHRARAKKVIQIFLNGGMSQVDTFDYRPSLVKRHGQTVDFGIKFTSTGAVGPLMKSPFAWKQHGKSGRWVTEVFPHMATCVDDLAFLMAMTAKTNLHGTASYLQNTGFMIPGFPCAGAWVSYALGRIADNLPTFVVLPDPRGLPYNNMGNFSAGFLPSNHQGTVVGSGPTPIADLTPSPKAKFVTPSATADGLAVLSANDRRYANDRPGDSRLTARLESFELAAKMQLAAPEAFDLAREPKSVHAAYGTERPAHDGGFSRNCLLARRLVERGVRFVQVWSGMDGGANNWDNHGNIPKELPPAARQVDQPVAALLKDLKTRGLLSETLVVFTTEFGRMPFTQNSVGRDHNGGSYVSWLAGAGVKPGVAHGSSDEFGYRAAENKTTGYDLNATVLHLLGVNHEKLTVRHNGIDRRLTDVHGRVVEAVVA